MEVVLGKQSAVYKAAEDMRGACRVCAEQGAPLGALLPSYTSNAACGPCRIDLITVQGFDPMLCTIVGLQGDGLSQGTLTGVRTGLVFERVSAAGIEAGDAVMVGEVQYTVRKVCTDATCDVVHRDQTTGTQTTSRNLCAIGLELVNRAGVILSGLALVGRPKALREISAVTYRVAHASRQKKHCTTAQSKVSDASRLQVINPSRPPFDLPGLVRGTRLATVRGHIPVENLRPGDLVATRDAGLQPILWVGATRVDASGPNAPISIETGVLANTAPLRVSPRQRVLMRGSPETFVEARDMSDSIAIATKPDVAVEYLHILFERHQIIYAEGAATESFHPSVGQLASLDGQVRASLWNACPELRHNISAYGPSARNNAEPMKAAAFGIAAE